MTVVRPTDDHREALATLVAGWRWSPRAGLDALAPGAAAAATIAETRAGFDRGTGWWATSGRAVACTSVAEDPWATERLGPTIGRLSALVGSGPADQRARATADLLHHTVGAAGAAGIELLVARLHADDDVAVAAALAAGFRVRDVEHTFFADASRAEAPAATPGLELAVHQAGNLPALTEPEISPLVDRAGTYQRGHLHADPRIDPFRVDAFYRDWTRNALLGAWGSQLALARRDGQIVGMFTWVLDEDLAAWGLPVHNRSWAVATEDGRGTMRAMTQATVGDPGRPMRWTECETQVDNPAVARSLTGTGAVLASTHALILHAWTTPEV